MTLFFKSITQISFLYSFCPIIMNTLLEKVSLLHKSLDNNQILVSTQLETLGKQLTTINTSIILDANRHQSSDWTKEKITNNDQMHSIKLSIENGIKFLQKKQYSLAKDQFAQVFLLDKEHPLARAYYALACFEENPLSEQTHELINWCLASQQEQISSGVATLALATIFRYQEKRDSAVSYYQILLDSNYPLSILDKNDIIKYIKGGKF